MSEKKKTSWDYQKGKYKQISLKFDLYDPDDMRMYFYLTCKCNNMTGLLKGLLMKYIKEVECYE